MRTSRCTYFWHSNNQLSFLTYMTSRIPFLELCAGKMEVHFELDYSKIAAWMGKDGDDGVEGLTGPVQAVTLRGTVVARGYYGRPRELADSASTFLCVKGGVLGENGSVIGPIKFAIDTLSESVTLTPEHFKNCKKKFLTRKTIHGPNSISFEDNIYTGIVVFGELLFEIEVSSRLSP